MTKTELAARLAEKCDLSQTVAEDVIRTLFDTKPGHGIIAIELDAGREVAITGFGTFTTKHRPARVGRNPQTGAEVRIAARKAPVFRAGKGLKDRVAE